MISQKDVSKISKNQPALYCYSCQTLENARPFSRLKVLIMPRHPCSSWPAILPFPLGGMTTPFPGPSMGDTWSFDKVSYKWFSCDTTKTKAFPKKTGRKRSKVWLTNLYFERHHCSTLAFHGILFCETSCGNLFNIKGLWPSVLVEQNCKAHVGPNFKATNLLPMCKDIGSKDLPARGGHKMWVEWMSWTVGTSNQIETLWNKLRWQYNKESRKATRCATARRDVRTRNKTISSSCIDCFDNTSCSSLRDSLQIKCLQGWSWIEHWIGLKLLNESVQTQFLLNFNTSNAQKILFQHTQFPPTLAGA